MKRYRRAARMAVLGPVALSILVLTPLVTASCGAGRVNPDTTSSQLSFGIQMAKRGLWSEALFRFRQAERRDPGNARILNNIASAYEALGQFELALDYYQRALKQTPSNSDLRRNYQRFVEFYRNFKAETGSEDGDEEADDSVGEEGVGEEGVGEEGAGEEGAGEEGAGGGAE